MISQIRKTARKAGKSVHISADDNMYPGITLFARDVNLLPGFAENTGRE